MTIPQGEVLSTTWPSSRGYPSLSWLFSHLLNALILVLNMIHRENTSPLARHQQSPRRRSDLLFSHRFSSQYPFLRANYYSPVDVLSTRVMLHPLVYLILARHRVTGIMKWISWESHVSGKRRQLGRSFR